MAAVSAAMITFNTMPSRTIILMVRRSEANTMELGGVATGKQNAQLHAMAAGIMSNSGGSSSALAAAANTGMRSVAVAVFEVSSVNRLTEIANRNTKSHVGKPARPTKPSPII